MAPSPKNPRPPRDEASGADPEEPAQEPAQEEPEATADPAQPEEASDAPADEADADGEAEEDAEEDEEPQLLVRRGEEGFPEPPDDIVEAAKVAPDHWLNVVDQEWMPQDGQEPPVWARLGRWRSDENGEIVEWEHNPDYRPSPQRLGWPQPDSPADAAMQRAATGYGPESAVAEELAGTEVAVCVDEDGRIARTEAPDGTPAVTIFTPDAELPEGQNVPEHRIMHMDRLLDRLANGEEILFLSSTAPVALLVKPDDVRNAGQGEPVGVGAGE